MQNDSGWYKAVHWPLWTNLRRAGQTHRRASPLVTAAYLTSCFDSNSLPFPSTVFGQTCSSVSVSHGHQAADGPLPALFGRHVEHTFHLQDTNDNINTQQELLFAVEASTGGGAAAKRSPSRR